MQSEQSITLGPSKQYLTLGIILHVCATGMLLMSGTAFNLCLVCLCLQAWCIRGMVLEPYPSPDYFMLFYRAGRWIVCHRRSGFMTFNRIQILFDGGMFMLVRFTEPSSKQLVIFMDQLTPSTQHSLRLLALLRSTPK